MQQFTWIPRVSASGDITHRVLSAKFGDGYQQDAGDGINTKGDVWELSFVNREAVIKGIADFLDAHGGWKAFEWTPPLGVAGAYKAAEYNIVAHGARNFTLTVTFTRVYQVD